MWIPLARCSEAYRRFSKNQLFPAQLAAILSQFTKSHFLCKNTGKEEREGKVE